MFPMETASLKILPISLNPPFLDIVDIQPNINHAALGNVLWNVPFEKFLQFDGHFANPLATHFIIPGDDFPTVPLFGIGFYPFGNSLVLSARRHKLLKGVRRYFRKA